MNNCGEPAVTTRPVVLHRNDGCRRQDPVEVREEHRLRIAGNTGLPAQWGAEADRIDVDQEQIVSACEEPIGGQMNLILGGQVNKPDLGERLRTDLPRCAVALPVRYRAQMDQAMLDQVMLDQVMLDRGVKGRVITFHSDQNAGWGRKGETRHIIAAREQARRRKRLTE